MTHSARLRTTSALEVALFCSSILAFIWWIQPLRRPALEAGFYAFILAFAFGSSRAHRDSRARLGIRLDTAAACALRVALPTLIVIAGCMIVGRVTGADDPEWLQAPAAILRYTGWALLQQYALQGVVLVRLQDAGLHRRAPLVAAALFALMHLPNAGLMALTFAGGLIWCRAFVRAPSLLPLAVSHAVAALAADTWLPRALLHGLRVGPGYFRS